LKTFHDDRFGIEFRYPTSLIARECSENDYSEDHSRRFVACFARQSKTGHGHCDLSVQTSAMSFKEVAESEGWRHLRTEDVAKIYLRGVHTGDWLVPSRATPPEPAQPVAYHEWKGMMGSYSGPGTDDEGPCSACADEETVIVSDNRGTVIGDYVMTAVDDQECDPQHTLEVVLQTLHRIGNGISIGNVPTAPAMSN